MNSISPSFFISDDNNLSDEELDKMYAPKSMNSRITMAPVHIYRILASKSNPSRHFSQVELSNVLLEKYEIKVERKALSRYVHNLEDEGIGIRSSKKDGVWYDPSYIWEDQEDVS